jgi:hypothetical protein
MFDWWRRGGGSSAEGSLDAPVRGLRCSFCRKTQDEVAKLVAGPDVFICDECIDVCVGIVEGERRRERQLLGSPEAASPPAAAGSGPAPGTTACSLCGTPRSVDEMLRIEGRGLLCGACADAVEDALAQGRPAE